MLNVATGTFYKIVNEMQYKTVNLINEINTTLKCQFEKCIT